MKTECAVKHLLVDRSGEVRGMLLEDGTIVDMPPHHSDTLRAILHKGDRVRVQGEMHWSKRGRLHIRPRKIGFPPRRKVNS
ncbi:MAG: hypothetical protein U0798_05990 [Gemmataceae bacterium]